MIEEKQIESLTKRETEIIALVAQGLSNPEIAEKLFISGKTVLTHLQNLKGKTDTKNRVQLSNYYYAHIEKRK